MIKIRKSDERGVGDHGWLKSHHTFSFAHYYDQDHMGFRSLRVINEDRVAPGRGFGTHQHHDMEIISYVLAGALAHEDSMGNGSKILPGEVQYMSAGSGVTHSEFNHAQDETTHFLQIWILPNQKGLVPQYAQKKFLDEDKRGKLKLVVSQDGRENSIAIRQDISLFASLLSPKQELTYQPDPDRHLWLQIVRGAVTINDHLLGSGDGAAISQEQEIKIIAQEDSEFLLFDLN